MDTSDIHKGLYKSVKFNTGNAVKMRIRKINSQRSTGKYSNSNDVSST